MIESTNNKVVFSVDENMTFPFPYRFFEKENIQVFLDEKKLQSGTDYSIEDKADYSLGANITLNVADAKGKNLVVMRVLPVIQETSLPEKGKLPSEAIETQLDKIVMVQQQFGEELERCAKLPVYTQTDAIEYLENLVTVTVNSKDVALNAAVAAANSAQTAAISERNISLIWAEITGDTTLADSALLTVKEAAEATGAITTAKEIAIGEINNIGATAIAATNKAAAEAKEAADQATSSAGAISGTVADEITIQISQAVGAEGALGAAILGGIQDVENARQQALDKANETLSQFREGTAEFENAKNQGISQIDQKVAGVALDVETVLARAQIIADNYLDNAQATVSGSISDLEKMKEDALAAGDKALADLAAKRIAELQNLQKLLDDADSAASAAEQFRDAALSQAQGAAGSASSALSSAQNSATSAADALKSAQDAALSASNAHASELAASQTATNISNELVSVHNYSSSAHKDLFDSKLSLTGGTMTGTITLNGIATAIAQKATNSYLYIFGGTTYTNGASVMLSGENDSDKGAFKIRAAGNGTTEVLHGKTDGALTWKGKNIVRSINNSFADSDGNVNLKLDTIPIGTVIAMAAGVTPAGYLACNGAAVSRTTYAALFAVIGTKYGAGDGSTTFNLPNMRDRFIQGTWTEEGKVMAAGLPNITGTFGGTSQAVASGAIVDGGSGQNIDEGSGIVGKTYTFNASKSSAIYGASTTVQPPAVKMRFCIKY